MKKTRSDIDRLLSKTRADPDTGCWTWTGNLDKDGYGAMFRVGSHTDGSRRSVRPHRFAYASLVGPIPEGLVIDHLCRNRACQNPEHMEPVTPEENTRRGMRAQSTHCKNGHPFDMVLSSGGRACRICYNAYQRAYQNANGHKYAKAYKERAKESKNRIR